MRRIATAAAVAACVAAAVTGCRGSGDDGPESDPIRSTSTAVSSSSAVTGGPANGSVGAGALPATAGHGKCVDPASPIVAQAVSAIDSYYGHDFIVTTATPAALGSCPDLLWVEAGLAGGTGSSPERVLFFDADGFIRYDTEVNTAFTSVVGSTRNTVTVRYRWLNGQDVSANPTGGPVDVDYTLSGQNVIADRTVPDRALAPVEETTTAPLPPTTPPTGSSPTNEVAPPPSSTSSPSTTRPSTSPPSTAPSTSSSPRPTRPHLPFLPHLPTKPPPPTPSKPSPAPTPAPGPSAEIAPPAEIAPSAEIAPPARR
ncbi:LppP/LprE family lipoprotein [Gordonia sp. HY285]|uniref:LppP/LprE family lipoprotein n=1 Tax=Gordonia liuliyuniae TaxID=2911517 RepID=UPI001F459B1D|nr:LppP/LprE family lipoprotein [Gordonia liuliyuniae]MCF8611818.1 LppP/LprE family lipoprotein [Gordonia liuliyuniae]